MTARETIRWVATISVLGLSACSSPLVSFDEGGALGGNDSEATTGESSTGAEQPEPEVGPSGISLIDPPSCDLAPEGMVYVAAGAFWMGCDQAWEEHCFSDDLDAPLHAVHLDQFAIDRTEVTVAAYLECVHNGPCQRPTHHRWMQPFPAGPSRPIWLCGSPGASSSMVASTRHFVTKAESELAMPG